MVVMFHPPLSILGGMSHDAVYVHMCGCMREDVCLVDKYYFDTAKKKVGISHDFR